MPPDTPPPDDARGAASASSSEGGNVVDPTVLAERRAQRAEQAEQSAARRAADAQVLAAELARERARLEAERDAARAEAAAAREGADAAIAEARHMQLERDALRGALEQARAERDALAAERVAAAAPEPAAADVAAAAPVADQERARRDRQRRRAPRDATDAPHGGHANGRGVAPAGWAERLRRELAVARSVAAVAPRAGEAASAAALAPVSALARERRLLARRAAAPVAGARLLSPEAQQRRGDRAAPITALALERERSSRLQAQLDASLAVQRELRTHIAALQRAVHQRVEAERRIEAALRRVREELTAVNALAAGRPVPLGDSAGASALAQPAGAFAPAPAPVVQAAGAAALESTPAPRAAAGSAAPSAAPMPPGAVRSGAPVLPASGFAAASSSAASREPVPAPPPADAPPPSAAADPAPSAEVAAEPPSAPTLVGLDPLRLSAARERLRASAPVAPAPAPLPAGPPAPWIAAALQRLLADDPQMAGRLTVGLLPALGLAAERPLRCDLTLAGRGCFAVDVDPGRPATVAARVSPRPRGERDLAIAADAVGLARLLHGRRSLRRPARVRGGRRTLRELRRAAQAPLALRDLGAAGVAPEPALALRLVALAIDPAATQGERFAVAHAPLAGGPVDAWLRIADGAPPEVVTQAPAEPVRLTLRCTRGALLALLAGAEPAAGERGTLDGDERTLALLRGWIAQTEHPAV